MISTNLVANRPTTEQVMSIKTALPPAEADPLKVLEFAHKAAKALKDVIDAKSKKVIIGGEVYLTFEDWQTIARFYNITVGTESTKPTMKNDQIFGYESKAVAYREGVVISSAEASTSRDELNWKDKPSFQLKSMAQTRAAAKCLRNVLAWVVILAGYKPTPAEEMTGFETIIVQPNNKIDSVVSKDFNDWEKDAVTSKQLKLLKLLIVEKINDEDLREQRLQEIGELDKTEASRWISNLLNNKELVCSF